MINALQHVGLGVQDVDRTYAFWRNFLCFKLKLNDHTGCDKELAPILGDLMEMRLLMALNAGGGGLVELCQHISIQPKQPSPKIEWGDLGIFEVGLKVFRIDDVYRDFVRRGVDFVTPVQNMSLCRGGEVRFAYLRDPDGLLIQLIEESGGKRPRVCGVTHVAIGVSDMKAARDFYSRVLGFTHLVHESKDVTGINAVTSGKRTQMVILKQPAGQEGNMVGLEAGTVKLVNTVDYKGKHIYEGRKWGDIGCMELALDVTDINGTYKALLGSGATPYIPPTRIDMGSGSIGTFAYVKDPDGTTIEIVEIEKVMLVSPKVTKNVLKWPIKALERLGIL